MTRTDGGSLKEALRRMEQMREQLKSQGRLASLGALVAGILHEIKNPLNLIKNFTGISEDLSMEIRDTLAAREQEMSPGLAQHLTALLDKLHFNLGKIEDQSKRTSAIVERMLRHSRQDDRDFKQTDVNALVDDYLILAYHGIRAVATDFNVQIEKHYDLSMSAAQLSPPAIGQAVLNILTNAFQAMVLKQGRVPSYAPKMVITTKDRGDVVEISIKDNGIGIKRENLPRIFKPFFTTKTGSDGTGLGLAISYDLIVTDHKGEIAVSTKEGKYTEFVVSLPKQIADGSKHEKNAAKMTEGRLRK